MNILEFRLLKVISFKCCPSYVIDCHTIVAAAAASAFIFMVALGICLLHGLVERLILLVKLLQLFWLFDSYLYRFAFFNY